MGHQVLVLAGDRADRETAQKRDTDTMHVSNEGSVSGAKRAS